MSNITREETWKKTVADMQGEIHNLQMTIVRLKKQLNDVQNQLMNLTKNRGQYDTY